ncbi:phytoene desaturase [Acidobacteria bacterium Mor1]|nr:phytoene desaturase [Acidobacteria bacterium Mor1]
MTNRDERVAVIGGGLGGLAAACTLAARGYQVTLLEKNPWFGGKAAVLEEDGFRFDMGPTILTVPRVLERIFGESGRDLHRELDLIRLDPQWRCFFEDGSVLDLHEHIEKMTGELQHYAGEQVAAGYKRFIELSERLHGISEKFFFWKSVEDFTDTMNFRGSLSLSTLSDVAALRMGRTVAGTIRSRIGDDRVAQMLDHFTQYVGSSPYNSPAVLCSIAHMQTEGGVWYPRGGTRAVPVALAKLATELGVEMRHSTGIDRIETKDGRTTGVVTHRGETIPVSAVVSNMDTVRTHKELINGDVGTRFMGRRKYEPACSGVVLYLGLKQGYDHLLHHNFVFSEDPEAEFEAIYGEGVPAPDPTCYVAAPARSEPEVAPEGGEALYVLVHAPYLRDGQDWSAMYPAYRKVILDKLKRVAGMDDIEDRIVVDRALTPQDIHERYRVLRGAIYGLASHGTFNGAFKPGNRSRDIEGLYLAGGSAHPGPGMPMALMSGWIAADTLDQDGVASKTPLAGGDAEQVLRSAVR